MWGYFHNFPSLNCEVTKREGNGTQRERRGRKQNRAEKNEWEITIH